MSLLNSELWERHPELAQVLWCLQNGDGFNLYICQYSSLAYRQQLTAALLQQCTAIEISALDLPEQQLIDEALHAALAQHPPEMPVFFYDLERFLLSIDQQKNLRYVRQLNWRRSGFQRLQRSVVLWLPIAALDLLARYAPDFYDWCSGFYQFSEPQAASPSFLPAAFENQKVSNLSLTEKQSWLAVLMESLQDDSLEDAERAKQLVDVGDLHEAIGNYQEAESYYQQALGILQQLGYEKDIAVTQGRIADILEARGELDEALRIRQQEQMPVYERLGEVRSRAVTLGKIADILQARGELDEALRIRQDELIPVFERLGDVRERAVCFGKIADILQARGELDEALRIRQDELIPVFERLGDVRNLLATQANTALLLMKFTTPRREEANQLFCLALAAARKMRIPEEKKIEKWLQRFEMDCQNQDLQD